MSRQDKHHKTILILVLCASVCAWLIRPQNSPSSQPASSVQTSDPQTIAKVQPTSTALVRSPASEDETKKKNEIRQKQKEFYAKVDACKRLEEDIKRPEIENFKRKVDAALANDIGDWFLNGKPPPTNSKPVSRIDKFYRATALSGFLNGTKTAKYPLDLETALKLANDVIAEDPKNSAPYMLKARIYDSMNKKTEAQKILEQATAITDHYDSYMIYLNRKIFNTIDGLADSLISYDIERPLLSVSSRTIGIIEKYKNEKLGEQIMAPAKDDKKLIAELEWSSWDYQVAKYTLERITPGKKLPDHMEIHPHKYKILAQQFPEYERYAEIYKPRDKDDDTFECDLNQQQDNLALLRKVLARSK